MANSTVRLVVLRGREAYYRLQGHVQGCIQTQWHCIQHAVTLLEQRGIKAVIWLFTASRRWVPGQRRIDDR